MPLPHAGARHLLLPSRHPSSAHDRVLLSALRPSGLRLSPEFSLLPASKTNPGLHPLWGPELLGDPSVPMATAVTSLWAQFTTRVRSLAVAKGTRGVAKSRKAGDRGGGERCGLPKVRTDMRRRRRPRASSRGQEGMAPSRGPPCRAPCLPLFVASEWARPRREWGVGRWGAVLGRLGPAPARPPDAPPFAPRSPHAPGCSPRAAAAVGGAGCRPRCCRWT